MDSLSREQTCEARIKFLSISASGYFNNDSASREYQDVTFFDEVFAAMVPFIVLLVSFLALRSVGLLGVTVLDNMDLPLRIALFLMFLVGASAHWGKGRPDLVRMVPPAFAHAEALVTMTGVLEILGAVGLLVPITSRLAAVCLAILLLALFPANIRAAREHLTILGRPAPGLVLRGAIQLVFLSALVTVAVRQRV